MGPSRSCWNGTSASEPEEIISKGTRVSCVYYQKKVPIRKKSGDLFNDYRKIFFAQNIYTINTIFL